MRIKDIAKILNVSPSTVSKALNNRPGVNPALREKIIETAQKLNYKKDMIASSLRTARSYIIGIMIPDVSNSFFGRLVLSIEKILYQRNYRYILSNTDEETKKELEYISTFMRYNTDGIITATSAVSSKQKIARYYRNFLAQKKPVVFVDRLIKGLDASYVIVDNIGAAYEAVLYLKNRGHRKIGAVVGPINIYTSKKRFEGFIKAIKDLQLETKEQWILRGEYSIDISRRVTKEMFNKIKELPTALISFNNIMTIGILEAFEDLGVNIPNDISLISFDDTPWHRFSKVPITSIEQPVEEMGIIAATILVELLDSSRKKNRKVVLKAKLIERGSVRYLKN